MVMRKILISLLGVVLLIPLGLCSRHVSWIPEETGDALWTMMVFCLWRMILVKKNLQVVLLVSLIHSFLVEFSQMVRWSWLVSFRNTFVGHMMLGQGFLWIDLLAYLISGVIIYYMFRRIEGNTITVMNEIKARIIMMRAFLLLVGYLVVDYYFFAIFDVDALCGIFCWYALQSVEGGVVKGCFVL